MKKIMVISLLVVSLLLTGGCKKEADEPKKPEYAVLLQPYYPTYDSAEEIVEKADLIFSGTVKNISFSFLDIRSEAGTDSQTGLSEPSEEIPYTLYEIEITNLYKGEAKESVVTLRCMGGIWEDTEYILEGKPEIAEGETYLFLAATYENAYPTLLNLDQSIYHLDEVGDGTVENGNITLPQILEVLE